MAGPDGHSGAAVVVLPGLSGIRRGLGGAVIGGGPLLVVRESGCWGQTSEVFETPEVWPQHPLSRTTDQIAGHLGMSPLFIPR